LAREAQDNTERTLLSEAIEQRKFALERKRKALEAQIDSLKKEFEAEEAESMKLIGIEENRMLVNVAGQKSMAESRKSKYGGKPDEK
jgi:hypothetical protein